MKRKTVVSVATLAAICLADVATFNVAQAFNMGDMMKPGKWFGDSDRDRYRDRYYDRGYYGGRYGGPYGYGGPGYGGPYGGWGGYGPYGGGYPGYGGYGGYGGQPSTIVVNPSSGNASRSAPPRLPE